MPSPLVLKLEPKVLVHDRSQALVGTWRYFAQDHAAGPAGLHGELPVRQV